MKGDFSRFTFDRRKHYADVRLQQGRVQLDADWNEQGDIAAYQRHTLAADVIGRSGAPDIGGGFDIRVAGNTLRITSGRYYVDGLLCENEEEVPIDGQPHLPGFVFPTAAGSYLAYLDVWQRSVTALEDENLLELALKGADTATRLRTMWQVKVHPVGGQTSFPSSWEPDQRPRPTLEVRAVGDVTENQLYRIEVHKPGPLGVATFKWSRDNGSIAALIENPAGSEQIRITRQIGPDQGGFETGQWIEVTDEKDLLLGQPGTLARLSSVVGQLLTVEAWPTPSGLAPDLPNDPQIRRWDSDADPLAELPLTNDGYIALDANLEVRFGGPTDAYFRTGDYWVVPVRAAAGVLWPTDASDAPLALPPHGVQHHYAPLYLLQLASGNWTLTRPPYRKVFQGRAGEEKLNRTEDDRMTASLTITGNLTVEQKVAVGQALTVDGALIYRDGNQLAGRVLTSDAGGNATWKTIGPVFLDRRVDIVDIQVPFTFRDWTLFHLTTIPTIPPSVRAVILEAEAAKSFPDRNEDPPPPVVDSYIKIRRELGAPENHLLRGRAAGDEDFVAWSNQGVFPAKDNSFEYYIDWGFENCTLRIIGYFP